MDGKKMYNNIMFEANVLIGHDQIPFENTNVLPSFVDMCANSCFIIDNSFNFKPKNDNALILDPNYFLYLKDPN